VGAAEAPAVADGVGLAVAVAFGDVLVGFGVAEALAVPDAVALGEAEAVTVGDGVKHSSEGAVLPVRSRFLTIRWASYRSRAGTVWRTRCCENWGSESIRMSVTASRFESWMGPRRWETPLKMATRWSNSPM
jgi:hypothetical protein